MYLFNLNSYPDDQNHILTEHFCYHLRVTVIAYGTHQFMAGPNSLNHFTQKYSNLLLCFGNNYANLSEWFFPSQDGGCLARNQGRHTISCCRS